ncbi:MAG: beta-lactamase family protein [Clostridia bacterium]|nr:beta-lactamase family protein [Clostridia bacterium]
MKTNEKYIVERNSKLKKISGNIVIIIIELMIIITLIVLIVEIYFFLLKTEEEKTAKHTFIENNISNNNITKNTIDENIINENIIEEPENKVITVELTSAEGMYDHDAYQAQIEKIARKYGATGVSVAFFDEGKVIDTFLYGYAIKGRQEMTDDTKVRIASISKIFVGLATMFSCEKRTMDLDEDIGTYWNCNIRTSSSNDVITPRSILTHTSSISDTEDLSATFYSNMLYRLRSGSGIRNRISGDINNYYYNNYAMDVLGMTVELANGETLDTILNEGLYSKLGIDAAFFAGDLEDNSNVATLYQADGSIGFDSSRLCAQHEGAPGSKGWAFSGGVTISAKDLGKVMATIANDGVYEGQRYISQKCIEELEYHKNNNLDKFWQCQPLCYQGDMYDQGEFYYHTGSAYGVYNLVGYNPNTKQGVAILTTGANGSKDEEDVYCICSDIAELLLNIL